MPLSCEPCRERKIKCPSNINRGREPCATCVRRGVPSSECVYLRDQWQRRAGPDGVMIRPTNDPVLVARIDRLERLLKAGAGATATAISPESLPNQPASEPFPPNDTGPDSDDLPRNYPSVPRAPPSGIIVRYKSGHEKFESSYSGWASILRGNPHATGIKTDLETVDVGSLPLTTSITSVAELLEMLPPASYTTDLKNIYFEVFAPVSDLSFASWLRSDPSITDTCF